MSTVDIGTAVAIATGVPATNDKAGYEAMTWVVVNGIIEAPTFATSHADIEVPDLATGFTTALKGAETGVDSSIVWRTIAADAGQAAVIAAAAARATYSIRTIEPGATVYKYAHGIVKSFEPNKPTVSSFDGGQAMFRPNIVGLTTTAPS